MKEGGIEYWVVGARKIRVWGFGKGVERRRRRGVKGGRRRREGEGEGG
jgi:hypothetical protein